MKIALLADIHGNLPALQAVLAELKQVGVDRTIFLGDYSFGLPFVNETVSLLCSVPHAVAVRGNGEDRLLWLAGQERSGWTDGQMRAAYWTVRQLSRETFGFLASLPDAVCVEEGPVPVVAAHTMLRGIGVDEPLGGVVPPALPDGMPEGVYVFGHTHRPWHAVSGNTLLVNPGSVGLPMDGIPKASYAILSEREGSWQVALHRASYDVEDVVAAILSSSQRVAAPVWTALSIRELRTAQNHVYPFLAWAEKYAWQIGDSRRPFAPETWEAAYHAWNFDPSVPANR